MIRGIILHWAHELYDQWPDLERIPEGRDLFANHPIHYPRKGRTMPRRRVWKFCPLPDYDDVRALSAYRQSNAGAWRNYTIVLDDKSGLETDMPWTELRRWFSYAGVRMPDMGTSDEPSWIIYDDTGRTEWPTGPLLSWSDLDEQ